MIALRSRRLRRVAWLFLLPNFLGFLCFTAWPVVAAFLLGFTSWDLLTPPRWVGLANFVDLLGFHQELGAWVANDPLFWKYLGNTFFFLLGLPVNMVGALGLALVLNQKLPGVKVYRLIVFFPSILAGTAIFYLWRFMYNADYGLINVAIAHLGLRGPNWLGSVTWSKPALMLMSFWTAVGGGTMILYLAALQSVPPELYEAATIDGANAWQRFRVVTWPAVMPVTFFVLTMGLIYGLQSGFDSAYIMTAGGPNGSTTTVGFYIYTQAYQRLHMGYAAAISWVLFVMILGVTLLNWRRGGRNLVT